MNTKEIITQKIVNQSKECELFTLMSEEDSNECLNFGLNVINTFIELKAVSLESTDIHSIVYTFIFYNINVYVEVFYEFSANLSYKPNLFVCNAFKNKKLIDSLEIEHSNGWKHSLDFIVKILNDN